MFPLRDDNPTLGTSIVTFLILGLNVAAWILIQGMGTEPSLSISVCLLGATPADLLGNAPDGLRVPLGPGAECVLSGPPDWRTPFTSMFMHGSWFHLIGNMWFLYVFADNVEDAMGSLRFVAFYVLCGLAAVATQVWADPQSAIPMVGASGAIGGVMGAYAVLYPRVPVHMLVVLGFYVTRIVVPAYLMLGYWFVLQLLGGIPTLAGSGGGVAFWAHVGGFAAGVVLVLVFRNPERIAAHREHVRRARLERFQ